MRASSHLSLAVLSLPPRAIWRRKGRHFRLQPLRICEDIVVQSSAWTHLYLARLQTSLSRRQTCGPEGGSRLRRWPTRDSRPRQRRQEAPFRKLTERILDTSAKPFRRSLVRIEPSLPFEHPQLPGVILRITVAIGVH